jgi:hypothetical protein
MDLAATIGFVFDAIPAVRYLWRKAMERHMEIELLKPYSKAPSNTLPRMISTGPILELGPTQNPYVYIWADLRITNHKPNRREFILGATLHIKKRHWVLWRRTLVQAPIRKHTGYMESGGPLLENIVIEPMTAPLTITVDAKQSIPASLPYQKVELWLEFKMIGPTRRIRRYIDPKEFKTSGPDKEGSQT